VLGLQSRLILPLASVRQVVRDGRRIKLYALVDKRERCYALQPATADVDEAYRLLESLHAAAVKRGVSVAGGDKTSGGGVGVGGGVGGGGGVSKRDNASELTAIEGSFTEQGDAGGGFGGQLTIEDWSLLVKGLFVCALCRQGLCVVTIFFAFFFVKVLALLSLLRTMLCRPLAND
jgi:uncharacterized membrane protein